jgi:hypothetical protein
MLPPELTALVEANAWTYGPNATALRVLRLTRRLNLEPRAFWEDLLAQCPRMAPLGYWRAAIAEGGRRIDELEDDFLRRESVLVEHLRELLGRAQRILLVGHDREIDALWSRDDVRREYRYLVLDGAPGVEPPGTTVPADRRVRLGEPYPFVRLEEALDWADVVVLAGFILHRQNLLGPSQVRPLLATARDQTDAVLLLATNERRVTLGEGAPREYRDDFRPYLWQASVTGLVSEWHHGHEGTHMGWLPLPPDVLRARFGEELFPP